MLVAAEAVQTTAAVVHILLELDHLLKIWFLDCSLTNTPGCFFPNVVADNVKVFGRFGLLFRPVDCKTTGLRWM